MVPLRIVKGDATGPQARGPKIIAHVCNDLGGWGKGFVVAISRRWPEPERAFRQWHRARAGNDFGLGAVQVVQVKPDVWVANMVAQRGIRTARSTGVPASTAVTRAWSPPLNQIPEAESSARAASSVMAAARSRWKTNARAPRLSSSATIPGPVSSGSELAFGTTAIRAPRPPARCTNRRIIASERSPPPTMTSEPCGRTSVGTNTQAGRS